ncbi:hypothetical protein [Sphingomicrobium sediminis]|uniref:Uncharacterized protein n=1 Tax=Sphingomicrobium sediminis TaxID=2950949 RepID=A0A9X2EK15_9SPHN|nr:hypothetical protein [Sphingomicrobium sediminis]MCM8557029.1 hypothetical protein [Sphingomicrobium sediminis]
MKEFTAAALFGMVSATMATSAFAYADGKDVELAVERQSASAFNQPTPTPTPTPTPPPPPERPIGNPGGGFEPPCTGDNCPGYSDRRPNAETFEREFYLRQMEAAMGTPANRIKMWQEAQRVAQCLHRRAGEETDQLVGGAMLEDEKFERLANGLARRHRSCVTDESATVPGEVLNAALMELLVLNGMDTMRFGLGSVPVAQAQAFIEGDGEVDVDAIGRCVAILSPARSLGVLESEPGTDAELQALNSLYRSAQSCGLEESPEDIDPIFQRVAVAGGLYYWGTNRYGTVEVEDE